MKKVLAACAVIPAALLLAACGSAKASTVQPVAILSPATISITGSLTLTDSSSVLNLDDVNCQGMDGYDDITPGAPITITDPHGVVIGVGQLGNGLMVGSGFTRQCKFGITIPNIPSGEHFYGIAIGHRSPIQEPEADVSALALAIGS